MDSVVKIRYKNNHSKIGNILFTLDTNMGQYVVYHCDDDYAYAAKLVDGKMLEIDNDDVKELIIKILSNFDKEV